MPSFLKPSCDYYTMKHPEWMISVFSNFTTLLKNSTCIIVPPITPKYMYDNALFTLLYRLVT